MSQLADVIAMPVRRGAAAAVGSVSGAFSDATAAARRATADPGMIDDWGRDPALVRSMMFAARLRWSVTMGGEQHLSKRKGALIVVNTRRLALAPVFAAFAITEATGRPVRFVGRPDDAPIGAFARRAGALLDDPDEVGGALRAGELVVLGAAPATSGRRVGIIDHFHVGAAFDAGVPVYPAATASTPITRHARVEIGDYVRSRRRRRGPLRELELADQLAARIELLLDELGETNDAWPFDLPGLLGVGR